MLILLAVQAATAVVNGPAPPERFSILAPPPAACRSPGPASEDIVVCASAESARLPLPEERGPPRRPLAANPYLDGRGAMAMDATPCAATQRGCQVGVDVFGAGTAAVRLIQKLVAPDSCCEAPGEATDAFALVGDAVGGVGRMFAKKPDKSNRVAIDLSAPPPAGRVMP